MNEMYTIYVHFPCAEDYMDKAVQLEIQMPFVPRIGDCLFIDPQDYKHLERKVEQTEALKKRYKRWIYGGQRCSFDDASIVIAVVWNNNDSTIHIELGENLDEERD